MISMWIPHAFRCAKQMSVDTQGLKPQRQRYTVIRDYTVGTILSFSDHNYVAAMWKQLSQQKYCDG